MFDLIFFILILADKKGLVNRFVFDSWAIPVQL